MLPWILALICIAVPTLFWVWGKLIHSRESIKQALLKKPRKPTQLFKQRLKEASMNKPGVKLQVHLKAFDLPRLGMLTEVDTMASVSLKSPATDNKFSEIARSEIVESSCNPDYATTFTIDYHFEELQTIQIEIFALTGSSSEGIRNNNEFISLGYCSCSIGQVLTEGRGTLIKALLQVDVAAAQSSRVQIVMEEIRGNTDSDVVLKLSAAGVEKMDLLSESDPFLQLAYQTTDGSFTVFYRTEVVEDTANPSWRTMEIPLWVFCNSDWDRIIQIECLDWDQYGTHDVIGKATVTLRQLLSQEASLVPLKNPNKMKQPNYKHSGLLRVESCRIEQGTSFVQLITSGLELNFTVAIDFTASNGDPRSSKSLHYVKDMSKNEYMQALLGIGSVLESYDTDKLFPALGFGAKLKDGVVSHDFALTGDRGQPDCEGINGIIMAYQQCLNNVELWGPTNFAPVIRHAARYAGSETKKSKYCILMIITDGAITDIQETKNAIIESSALPFSIIIVGVGDADFSAMEELDSDNELLHIGLKTAQRDIVQFVRFRDFQFSHSELLARNVLAELPSQVLEYVSTNNIKAGPASLSSSS